MSIAKNYLYNLVYQIVTLLAPLITIPYISRVLGTEGVGTNAFTNSIVQYFVLAGSIGISMYGNREIALVRDNREKFNKTFWGIFYLKLITTTFALCAYFIFLLIVEDYHWIFVVQSIYIIAAMVDITWLFLGLEDFKRTVIRNLIVKIISTIGIFVFVKHDGDLWIYVLLLACSHLVGNLTLYSYLPKIVDFVKITFKEIIIHLKPTLYLFIPQISLQIYLVLNKTMLGVFSNVHEVGIFDNSDRIVKIILAIVTAMGVVMMPRIANTLAHGDKEKIKDYIYSTFHFASYLAIPLMLGLMAITPNFVPWFFGPGFEDTIYVINILCPIILFIAWSNVFGTQYLLGTGQTKLFTLSVTVGAVINLLLNFYFIPKFFAVGAAIATIIAEFTVTLTQYLMIRKDIILPKLFKGFFKLFIAGVIMFAGVYLIGINLEPTIISTFVQIIIGTILYIGVLCLLRDEINDKIITYILKQINKA